MSGYVDRALEQALRQPAGAMPDVVRAVLGATLDQRRRACDRVDTARRQAVRRSRGSLRAAALLLVGASIVVTTALSERQPAQGGRTVVTPRDFDHWVELLAETTSVRVATSPGGFDPLLAAPVHVTLDPDSRRMLCELLSVEPSPPGVPCLRGGLRHLEFELTGRRVMRASVRRSLGANHPRLVVADGRNVRISLDGALGAVLAPWLDRLDRVVGDVSMTAKSRAVLDRLVVDGRSESIESLVAKELATRDLELLDRLPRLTALDVVASPDLELAGLRAPTRGRLRALAARADQLGGANDWLGQLDRLHSLRVASRDWTAVAGFLGGVDCGVCHQSAEARPTDSVRGLDALRDVRTLRRLVVHGAVLDGEFADVLTRLPLLSEIDLTGCDLSAFDFATFARLPLLRELRLDGAAGVTLDDVDALVELAHLRRLDLRYLRDLDDAEVHRRVAARR